MAESMQNFADRVMKLTGQRLEELELRYQVPNLGGHIMCRRGDILVVASNYPYATDEHGTEFYDEFVVLDLSPPLPLPRGTSPWDGRANDRDENLWRVACDAHRAEGSPRCGAAFKAAWIAHTPIGRTGWKARAVARADEMWECYLHPADRPVK